MRFIPYLSAVLLIAILAGGCSSPSKITEADSPGVVMEKMRQRNQSIRTLQGSGRISIDSPEFSGAGNIDLRLSKPDTVLLRITGPFGISVGSGLITSDVFTFYDGYNNTVVRGETSAHNLRRAFRMTVEFNDIIEILSGTYSIPPEHTGAIPRGGMADGTYNLIFGIPTGTEEYRVDMDYAAVTRFLEKDEDGKIVRDIRFRDFRKHDGYYIPHVVTFLRPDYDESLSIVYDRISVNDMPLDFSFSVPDGARVIQL